MSALVRLGMVIVVVVACAAIIVTHGVRGIAFVVVLMLAATLPRTRVWGTVERVLVRATGSRKRAAALVLVTIIGVLAAVNVYEYVR
ncbi:MAG: hypothetical protein NVSMB22_12470 [Chloroflexota bacterium]